MFFYLLVISSMYLLVRRTVFTTTAETCRFYLLFGQGHEGLSPNGNIMPIYLYCLVYYVRVKKHVGT